MPLGKLRQDFQPIPLHRGAVRLGMDVSQSQTVFPAPPWHPAPTEERRSEPQALKWRRGHGVALMITASIALWLAILLVVAHLGAIA
jgi:hypothetical protein